MSWKDRFSSKDPRATLIETVTGRLRKAKDVDRIESGADDFTLLITRKGSTKAATANLHNLWADLERVPDRERRAGIERFVRAVVSKTEDPTTWSDAAPRLMPAVRAASFHAQSLNQAALEICTWPLAPLLSVHSVVDSPDSMSFVTVDLTTSWGVDPAVVRVRANANLRESPLGYSSHPTIAEAHVVATPDGYASSWLATPEALLQVLPPSAGRLLAVAPSRDLLCLVGEDDAQSVVAALEWASEMYTTSTRNLSPVAYVVEVDGIHPWIPPSGHPAAAAANLSSEILVAGEYGYQQGELQRRLGDDVFVASFKLVERDDGTTGSLTVWTADLHALLPKTDEIYFNDVDNESTPSFRAPWDAVAAVVGDSLSPATDLGLDPLLPRWRVKDWPDAGAVASLRKVTA